MKNIIYHLIPLINYHLITYSWKTDIAQGIIFTGKRSGIVHNFTINVNPGYMYVKKFRGGVQWYMMESEDFISTTKFKSKKENRELASFNKRIISFRISIKKVYFFLNDRDIN